MRALPICFSSTHAKRLFHVKQIPCRTRSKHCTPAESGACKTESAARHAGPNLYQCRRISRQPFRDLGEVSGDSCQASNQDSPPSIPTARKRMQINASKMKANVNYRIAAKLPAVRQAAIVRLYVSALRLTLRRNEQFPVRANRRYSLAL